MDKIRVLHVINSMRVGGAEKLIYDMFEEYNKEKFQFELCCLRQIGPLARKLEREGHKAHCVNIRHNLDFPVVFKLARLMRKERIDVVHTHLALSDFYGRCAAALAGTPVLISTCHNFEDWRRHRLYNLIDRWTAAFADRITAVCNGVAQDIIEKAKISEAKILVIHNGVIVTKFSDKDKSGAMREIIGTPRETPVVGSIGRLAEQKGFSDFLLMAGEILREGQSVAFVLVGDGPLRETLEAQAADLGIHKHVRFLGIREDIEALLAGMDIYVNSSRWEGLPVTILEAMAAEKPVVSYEVGGVPEAIEHEVCGILCSAGDYRSLARAVSNLLKNKEKAKRLGELAKERVTELFSLEHMTREFESLYESVYHSKQERERG